VPIATKDLRRIATLYKIRGQSADQRRAVRRARTKLQRTNKLSFALAQSERAINPIVAGRSPATKSVYN
jgi:hypothetical protein